MDQTKGCCLGYAADLVLFLTNEIHAQKTVSTHTGYVNKIEQIEGQIWSTYVENSPNSDQQTRGQTHLTFKKAVLANGSAPVRPLNPTLPELDLDLALTPSLLKEYITQNQVTSMAVVGSSHSAILALKNMTDCPQIEKVIHFYRSQLRFAVYQEGWILYDNTGLKGIAADWAREQYPSISKILKVKLSGDPIEEVDTYAKYHDIRMKTVYAVGFSRNNVPSVFVRGEQVELKFNSLNGQFNMPGIYGCGIAYPEQVTDPAGNVEFAVGFFKFMKFVKRVCSEW